ncbi:MAG: hypothetical protein OEW08_05140 [Gammaproteobacteria bacterium]|nr:hypothetical protein [Gammaproteobacteria bacterium]
MIDSNGQVAVFSRATHVIDLVQGAERPVQTHRYLYDGSGPVSLKDKGCGGG